MSFNITSANNLAYLMEMPPRLDAGTASEFRTAIQGVLARAPRTLTLNCKKLTYVDSTGLGLLTLAKREADRIGCMVTLSQVQRPGAVADVLSLVHFDRLFPVTYEDTDKQADT